MTIISIYIYSLYHFQNQKNDSIIHDFENWINENNLNYIMDSYLNSIIYYPDEAYSDGIHFTNEFLLENKNKILQDILQSIYTKDIKL